MNSTNRLIARAFAVTLWATVGAISALAEGQSLQDSDGLQIFRTENPPKLIIQANAAKAKAIDGDTLWLSIFKIRLKGIDTVESKQSCRSEGDVQCAEQTRRVLQAMLAEGVVRCEVQFDNYGRPAMHYSRYIATCQVNGKEINESLVKAGWAFTDEKATVPAYVMAQLAAIEQKLGVHRFVSEPPWVFRRRTKRGPKVEPPPCPPGQNQRNLCTPY
jgi:endonuclease YncB( thermonuclease family)